MAEFEKKKRFLRYSDKRCKKFLSRDFKKQCAYCKIREGDLGGPDDFEKDHFIPRIKGGSDDYENLYYSCSSCNGRAGKSDTWSPTLLDPCKDDIFDIHIELLSDYRFRDLTPQGDEYIKTLKLNRKSYINKRKTIASHRIELQAKLAEYKELYRLALSGGIIVSPQFFQDDIYETEKILEQGVNYRLSENYFSEDVDELIYSSLQKVGIVKCVDRDYDLFYELEINSKVYLCNVQFDNFDFYVDDKVFRYISADKIAVWKEIEKETPILVITFNQNDNNLYYTKLDTVLKNGGDYDRQKYIYYIYDSHLIKNFK